MHILEVTAISISKNKNEMESLDKSVLKAYVLFCFLAWAMESLDKVY